MLILDHFNLAAESVISLGDSYHGVLIIVLMFFSYLHYIAVQMMP